MATTFKKSEVLSAVRVSAAKRLLENKKLSFFDDRAESILAHLTTSEKKSLILEWGRTEEDFWNSRKGKKFVEIFKKISPESDFNKTDFVAGEDRSVAQNALGLTADVYLGALPLEHAITQQNTFVAQKKKGLNPKTEQPDGKVSNQAATGGQVNTNPKRRRDLEVKPRDITPLEHLPPVIEKFLKGINFKRFFDSLLIRSVDDQFNLDEAEKESLKLQVEDYFDEIFGTFLSNSLRESFTVSELKEAIRESLKAALLQEKTKRNVFAKQTSKTAYSRGLFREAEDQPAPYSKLESEVKNFLNKVVYLDNNPINEKKAAEYLGAEQIAISTENFPSLTVGKFISHDHKKGFLKLVGTKFFINGKLYHTRELTEEQDVDRSRGVPFEIGLKEYSQEEIKERPYVQEAINRLLKEHPPETEKLPSEQQNPLKAPAIVNPKAPLVFGQPQVDPSNLKRKGTDEFTGDAAGAAKQPGERRPNIIAGAAPAPVNANPKAPLVFGQPQVDPSNLKRKGTDEFAGDAVPAAKSQSSIQDLQTILERVLIIPVLSPIVSEAPSESEKPANNNSMLNALLPGADVFHKKSATSHGMDIDPELILPAGVNVSKILRDNIMFLSMGSLYSPLLSDLDRPVSQFGNKNSIRLKKVELSEQDQQQLENNYSDELLKRANPKQNELFNNFLKKHSKDIENNANAIVSPSAQTQVAPITNPQTQGAPSSANTPAAKSSSTPAANASSANTPAAKPSSASTPNANPSSTPAANASSVSTPNANPSSTPAANALSANTPAAKPSSTPAVNQPDPAANTPAAKPSSTPAVNQPDPAANKVTREIARKLPLEVIGDMLVPIAQYLTKNAKLIQQPNEKDEVNKWISDNFSSAIDKLKQLNADAKNSKSAQAASAPPPAQVAQAKPAASGQQNQTQSNQPVAAPAQSQTSAPNPAATSSTASPTTATASPSTLPPAAANATQVKHVSRPPSLAGGAGGRKVAANAIPRREVKSPGQGLVAQSSGAAKTQVGMPVFDDQTDTEEEEEETLPPEIDHWPNGNEKFVLYKNKALQFHRADGPAFEIFDENGQVRSREFWIDGRRHRTDGPAIEWFYENGQVESREFWIDGRRHRTDGPAIESFYENGQVESQQFWIDDEQLSEEEFEKATKNLNRDQTDTAEEMPAVSDETGGITDNSGIGASTGEQAVDQNQVDPEPEAPPAVPGTAEPTGEQVVDQDKKEPEPEAPPAVPGAVELPSDPAVAKPEQPVVAEPAQIFKPDKRAAPETVNKIVKHFVDDRYKKLLADSKNVVSDDEARVIGLAAARKIFYDFLNKKHNNESVSKKAVELLGQLSESTKTSPTYSQYLKSNNHDISDKELDEKGQIAWTAVKYFVDKIIPHDKNNFKDLRNLFLNYFTSNYENAPKPYLFIPFVELHRREIQKALDDINGKAPAEDAPVRGRRRGPAAPEAAPEAAPVASNLLAPLSDEDSKHVEEFINQNPFDEIRNFISKREPKEPKKKVENDSVQPVVSRQPVAAPTPTDNISDDEGLRLEIIEKTRNGAMLRKKGATLEQIASSIKTQLKAYGATDAFAIPELREIFQSENLGIIIPTDESDNKEYYVFLTPHPDNSIDNYNPELFSEKVNKIRQSLSGEAFPVATSEPAIISTASGRVEIIKPISCGIVTK